MELIKVFGPKYWNPILHHIFPSASHNPNPTRITPNSRTLIDIIFSNKQNFVHAVSGNLTVSISDHLPYRS